jgi:regulator of protease activity HflC (stomatin/prohibitin superfamily)
MTRYPYAALQLEDEVKGLFPNSEMEALDEGDGFGVHRRFRFDKATSEALKDILDEVADEDVRIEEVENTAHGVVVTFAATGAADDRESFDLAEIHKAVEDYEKSQRQAQADAKAAEKKAAADKRAAEKN